MDLPAIPTHTTATGEVAILTSYRYIGSEGRIVSETRSGGK